MRFALVLLLTFAAANAALSMVRALDWPHWAYHILAISVGTVLWLLHGVLVWCFVRTRSPEFASNQEIAPGVRKWELTAGTGIVPRWVSIIGLVGIAFFLACPFELLAWLIRTLHK